MSPHAAGAKAAGFCGSSHHEPAADMGYGLRAAGRHVSRGSGLGSLDIRLVYYRGLNECRATGWISDSAQLARLMGKIDCREAIPRSARCCRRRDGRRWPPRFGAVCSSATPWRGSRRALCQGGGTRPAQGAGFHVQEGHDDVAEQAFREIARLTGGAWCRFDPGAAAQLRELLRAAAAYAAGGREALRLMSKTGSGAAKLLGQMNDLDAPGTTRLRFSFTASRL